MLILCIVLGLLIFLPARILHIVGVDAFVNAYRPWIGVPFMFLSLLWIVDAIARVATRVKGQARLRALSPHEKSALHEYIDSGSHTERWPTDMGVYR